jgi:predicted lipid-binding transport protein (Tim44 family)
MGNDSDIIQIVLLAMIAGFIMLRLRAVLGGRTGNEPDHDKPHGIGGSPENEGFVNSDDHEVLDIDFGRGLAEPIRKGLIDIVGADPHFNMDQFLDGAKSAHTMILEAFWAGDRESVEAYTSDEIAARFLGAIDAREEEGLILENRVVETSKVEINDARMHVSMSEITLKFVSDIIAITRNKDGEVVDGDLSDAIEVIDIWTFSRDTGSNDPNWLLVATRSE